jgi:hypothetical protein
MEVKIFEATVNGIDLQRGEKKNYDSYHIPGMSRIHKQKRNCCFFKGANNAPHEMKKAEICYLLQKAGHKYLTEVQSVADGRIIDIVDISHAAGQAVEYEVVDSSLTELTKKAIKQGKRIIVVKT